MTQKKVGKEEDEGKEKKKERRKRDKMKECTEAWFSLRHIKSL